VYGRHEDMVFARLRDPFGSLSRTRLVETLAAAAHADLGVTAAGAGSGLWRVLSYASLVAISVVDHRHTEVLVGINDGSVAPRPFAFHLFFKKPRSRRRVWKSGDQDTLVSDRSGNTFVSIVLASEGE